MHRIECYKEREIWTVNDLQYSYCESKKKNQVSWLVNITGDIEMKWTEYKPRCSLLWYKGICMPHLYYSGTQTPTKYRWENSTK